MGDQTLGGMMGKRKKSGKIGRIRIKDSGMDSQATTTFEVAA